MRQRLVVRGRHGGASVWGNNQWNYTFDGVVFENGTGSQVVRLTGEMKSTPVRISGDIQSVSYEYPDGLDDASDRMKNASFNSKAWDSPFDYSYKMRNQREFIKAFYATY